jgi:hypothetical protein
MPPLKTYIFICETDRIEITIKAYNENSANKMLNYTVKDSSLFKIKTT